VGVEAGGDGRAGGRPFVAVAPQAPAFAHRRVADGDRLVGAAVEVGRAGEALRHDVHAACGDGAGARLEEDGGARVAVPAGRVAADGARAGDLEFAGGAGSIDSQTRRDPRVVLLAGRAALGADDGDELVARGVLGGAGREGAHEIREGPRRAPLAARL